MRRSLPLALAALLAASTFISAQPINSPRNYLGFDANDYPGDALLPSLHQRFAFVGFWLNNPPGTTSNPWLGKRQILLRNGFGFLVVFNGRLDNEILKSQKSGTSAAALARQDAAVAVAAATRERFPPRTILFLDQEEGGRMLPEQAAYILAWTEAVAASAFRPGLYASGHPVGEGKGPDGRPATITTIQDIRQQVAAGHLHPIAIWAIQDSCPPAPGCVLPDTPPSPGLSGTIDATAWQFAQSPRTSFARACGTTYSQDNQCYAPGIPGFAVDLSSSNSPDPSHGR